VIKLENVKIVEVTDSFKNNIENLLEEYLTRSSMRLSVEKEKKIETMLRPRGKDKIWTTLKRLPYQKFYCTGSLESEIFFCGKTDDIVVEMRDKHTYNIGPYHVCISKSSILNSQSSPVHLFPDYDPLTTERHLHHRAFDHDVYGDDKVFHPLTARDHWCWSSVGPSYLAAVSDLDIVDMFRVLYIFITRLNWDSPLSTRWQYRAIEHGKLVK
jgi:hypothetical protein